MAQHSQVPHAIPLGRPPKILSDETQIQQSTLVTSKTYRKFQQLQNVKLSGVVFRGLCAYLYNIRAWNYKIDQSSLDGFICSYSTFTLLRGNTPDSYHVWFHNHGSTITAVPQILDDDLLEQISRENPYHFMYARKCLEAIVQEQLGMYHSVRFLTCLTKLRASWQRCLRYHHS